MVQRKNKGIFIRMSEQVSDLFKALADKKQMSQTNLIEHLVRKEADKEKLKIEDKKP